MQGVLRRMMPLECDRETGLKDGDTTLEGVVDGDSGD